jgi:hypothetical protein
MHNPKQRSHPCTARTCRRCLRALQDSLRGQSWKPQMDGNHDAQNLQHVRMQRCRVPRLVKLDRWAAGTESYKSWRRWGISQEAAGLQPQQQLAYQALPNGHRLQAAASAASGYAAAYAASMYYSVQAPYYGCPLPPGPQPDCNTIHQRLLSLHSASRQVIRGLCLLQRGPSRSAHCSAAGMPYVPQYPPAPGFGTYYPPKAEVWQQPLAQRWRAACAPPICTSLHVIVESAESAEPTC